MAEQLLRTAVQVGVPLGLTAAVAGIAVLIAFW